MACFPYLALEQAVALRPDGVARYRFALEKGLRKVMARMGVSTMASYRNSQLFEVIGLDPALCAEVLRRCRMRSGRQDSRRAAGRLPDSPPGGVRGRDQASAGHGPLSFPPAGRTARDFARNRAAHASLHQVADR